MASSPRRDRRRRAATPPGRHRQRPAEHRSARTATPAGGRLQPARYAAWLRSPATLHCGRWRTGCCGPGLPRAHAAGSPATRDPCRSAWPGGGHPGWPGKAHVRVGDDIDKPARIDQDVVVAIQDRQHLAPSACLGAHIHGNAGAITGDVVGPGLVHVGQKRPPRRAQLATLEVAHLVNRRRGHHQRLHAPDMVRPAGVLGAGLGRLQRRQCFPVGLVGAAQGTTGDIAQALLLDTDGPVPGGIGHHRDRHGRGQNRQRGATDDHAQPAHGRGSSGWAGQGTWAGRSLGRNGYLSMAQGRAEWDQSGIRSHCDESGQVRD